ncbi:phage major tail tube protein [Campylobacter sp. MG1]|uniref:phage major tail tube protein n=1 Tax=Campylobacter sp. MG1 TaxID=2976332 RepID=UPI00226CFAB6|nr:phage major tail tube protein [Campylobacter sp. MG1]
MNIYINGKSYFGTCTKIKIPDIVQTMAETSGALKRKVGTGVYESLELSFTLQVFDMDVFRDFAANNTIAHVTISIRESIHNQGNGKKDVSCEALGDMESITLNEDSIGGAKEISIKLYCEFFKLSVGNDAPLIYDILGTHLSMSDIDVMAQTRKNLEL